MKYSSFLAAMVLPTAVMASPCEYDRDVESIHTKVIESTRITDKSIRMMTDKTMQCTVQIESLVDGKWFNQQETFRFDPFIMDADKGCNRAVDRAKERIYSEVSPELFRSRSTVKCSHKYAKKRLKDIVLPLPKSMMNYGEHVEIKLNSNCRLQSSVKTYDGGYTLYGYKELCK